jgi:CHAT domain-containing protein
MARPAVPDWHPSHRLAADLSHRLTAFLNDDSSGVMAPDALAQAERLRSCAMNVQGGRCVVDGPLLRIVAFLRHARGIVLGAGDPAGRAELTAAVELFALLGKADPAVVPPGLRRRADAVSTPEVEDLAVLGNRALAAYQKWGATLDPEVLETAVIALRDCRAVVPEGHPSVPMALANLCAALRDRYVLRRVEADLHEAIEAGRTAVAGALAGDPNRWMYHGNLGGALVALPDPSPAVLDEAVACGREATASPLCPAVFHSHLGLALLARATRDPEKPSVTDLHDAVGALGEAVRQEPQVPRNLSNLGLALHTRFAAQGDPADLKAALGHTERAVQLTVPADPELFVHLTHHTLALTTKTQLSEEIEDLDALIASLRRVVEAAPEPLRGDRMRVLAVALGTRFGLTHDLRDVDEAIDLCRQALKLCGPGEDKDVHEVLGALRRARLADADADADEQIDALAPDEENASGLGSHLLAQALRAWESGDDDSLARYLERAITVLRQGDGPEVLFNLGRALDLSYERTGDPDLLDESTDSFQAALDAAGPDHAERAKMLSALATQVRKRGLRLDEAADLHRAVELSRQALAAAPERHPARTGCLTHLATALAARYELLMTEEDLEEAVRRGREATEAETPAMSAHERTVTWNNLGMLLRRAHERSHALTDLTEAIGALRTAVEAAPGGTGVGDAASNLCLALSDLYDRTGVLADLDEAVDAGRLAVQAYPDGHVNRPGALTNLVFVLGERGRLLGRRGDVDKAVRYGRIATRTMSYGHPDLRRYLAGLASALLCRYEVTGDAADLEEAADATRQSLKVLPDGDWRRVSSLLLLGQVHTSAALHALGHAPVSGLPHLSDGLNLAQLPDLIGRLPRSTAVKTFGLTRLSTALDAIGLTRLSESVEAFATARLAAGLDEPGRPALRAAVAAFREAATVQGVPAKVRFSAAAHWALRAVMLVDWPEALTAYQVAVAQLPSLAWHGLELEDRISGLATSDSIACDAAAAALHLGRPVTALQLLEQGRGVLLAQAVDSRFALPELAEYDAELAARIEELRSALNDTSDARRRRELAAELDASTEQAYRVLGLDGLLRAPSPEELREAAADGAVIVVNTSLLRCDALIVTRDTVRTVPLPDLDLAWVKEQAESLLTVLASPQTAREALEETLSGLAYRIVEPVLENLPPGTTRLWWCPTGPLTLLPLHAAGTLPDRHVCSYATTLRSLAQARKRQSHDDPGAVLVVDQAEVPALTPLPAARREALGLVTRLTKRTLLTGPTVTPPALRKALPRHTCLHFAGHARHDPVHPADSGLHCHGGLLTVEDISRLRLDRADLAFLAACETARGTERLPDEPVHLAGALQLAGFPHVVATQWMAHDDTTQRFTERFYTELCNDGRPFPARTAFALHAAVREIRLLDDDPLLWAVYVHTGP